MTREHNYVKAMKWLIEHEKILVVEGLIQINRFEHDTWCAMHYGETCNCYPDVYIDDKPVSYPKRILKEE